MNSTYVIAEAGVNHNGKESIAISLIDQAIECGADAIKFQTFKTENLVTKYADTADYQSKQLHKKSNQYSMLKNLELSYDTFIRLSDYCKQRKIDFLSSAFDKESLDFIVNKINPPFLKIPSGDITNGPLLLDHATTGKNIILSTGMASMDEISHALYVIYHGYVHGNKELLSNLKYKKLILSEKAKETLRTKVTLLHCTTEYPAPLGEINLKVLRTLSEFFEINVGYSDHTKGVAVSTAAVALGAKVIEKHFTIDNNLSGPDHKASLNPHEFKKLVKHIRMVEKSMGVAIKSPTRSEIKNKVHARKSLVASKPIKKGEILSHENVTAKRPGDGISPMKYWETINQISTRDYETDEQI